MVRPLPWTSPERLERALVRRARLAWAAARWAIHAGRVAVDGRSERRYRAPVRAGAVVTLDGQVLPERAEDGALLCHKPAGVACSHAPEDAPLLYDLLPAAHRHPDLQSAGRLDRDTTGLLVLSIDGALIQALTAPQAGRWKGYAVTWAGRLSPDATAQVAAGLVLAEEPPVACRPARLRLLGADALSGRGELWLLEGKHHQVKRMLRTLGAEVVTLHRLAIGALRLPPDLGPGSVRPATPAELACLLAQGGPGEEGASPPPGGAAEAP